MITVSSGVLKDEIPEPETDFHGGALLLCLCRINLTGISVLQCGVTDVTVKTLARHSLSCAPIL